MNKTLNIFLRYIIIILAGLGNLYIFYKIFTPLTLRAVSFLLSSPTIQNLIIFNSRTIELIPACIAGSAYYLLLILNLTTPNIKLRQRIKILAISFIALFILNTLRIVILAILANSIYFASLHMIFWYGVSTIFVVGIWICLVKIYKIKSIPVYTDFEYLYRLITKNKTKK